MLIHQHTLYAPWAPRWLTDFDQGVRDGGVQVATGVTILNGIFSWMIWALVGDNSADNLPFDPPWSLVHQIIWTFVPFFLLAMYLAVRRVYVRAWFGSADAKAVHTKYVKLSVDDRKELKPVYTHVMRNDRRQIDHDGTLEFEQYNAFSRAVDRAAVQASKIQVPDPILSRTERFIAVMDEIERHD